MRHLASDREGVETLLSTLTPEERSKFGRSWTEAAEWGARGTTHLGSRYSPHNQKILAGAYAHLPRLKFTTDPKVFGGDPVPVDNQDIFVALCSFGETEGARELLGRDGVNINKPSLHDRNALMSAALGGHADTVRMLIDSGAHVNASNESGMTALMFAEKGGNVDVINALIDRGAEINQTDVEGATALMHAAHGGNPELVAELIGLRADIRARDNYNRTALIYAAENGKMDAARVLIEGGADVDAANLEGQTALMIASYFGFAGTVSLLIQSRANVKAVDIHGRTALHYACDTFGLQPTVPGERSPQLPVVESLLDNGAEINARDNMGNTPLHDCEDRDLKEYMRTRGARP